MNRPRDPKGKYIKSKSDLSTKVPSDLFGGRNVPLSSSTLLSTTTIVELTRLEKLVYSVPTSFASRMERRT
jgi:hypothetical protein